MNTRRRCAYCGQQEDLTNEHIFPECFRKTFEAISLAKTVDGEKAILSALEIGDVCGPCNNGPLSQLDTNLCLLNDKYFSKIVHSGDCVRIEYDADTLLRMLLKIGYNVARVREWPFGYLRNASPYILGKESRPVEFRIFLQLMIPTPAKKTNLPLLPGTKEIPPLPISVYAMDTSDYPGIVAGFWVSIWSYRFIILLEDTEVQRRVRERTLTLWLKHEKGVCELTYRNAATVYASSAEVLDALKNSPIFHEQLSKARKLKSATELKKSRKLAR